MKKYEWYLFDLDNTLLDFNMSSAKAFNDLMQHFSLGNIDELHEIYHDINLSYWKKYEQGVINVETLSIGRFQDFLEEIKHEADAKQMSEKYLDFLTSNSHIIEGSLKILNHFKTSAKLSLITNGISDVQHRRIAKHDFYDFFEYIFISDEMGHSKPSQSFFEIVHNKIGSPNKNDVLVLGDNPISDIQGGKSFGYDTLYYNYKNEDTKHIDADYKINKWHELNV